MAQPTLYDQWLANSWPEARAYSNAVQAAGKVLLSPGQLVADAAGLSDDSKIRMGLDILAPTPGEAITGPLHLAAGILPLGMYRLDRKLAQALGTQDAKRAAEYRIAQDIAATRESSAALKNSPDMQELYGGAGSTFEGFRPGGKVSFNLAAGRARGGAPWLDAPDLFPYREGPYREGPYTTVYRGKERDDMVPIPYAAQFEKGMLTAGPDSFRKNPAKALGGGPYTPPRWEHPDDASKSFMLANFLDPWQRYEVRGLQYLSADDMHRILTEPRPAPNTGTTIIMDECSLSGVAPKTAPGVVPSREAPLDAYSYDITLEPYMPKNPKKRD